MPLCIDERPQKCVMCSREIVLRTATTPNPGAPEMLEMPIGAWIGFVQSDHTPEMIVCCSERCLRALLSH